MTPKQLVEHRLLLTDLMNIAHGMGQGTHTEADLLQHARKIEIWMDQQIDAGITEAIRPLAKFKISK